MLIQERNILHLITLLVVFGVLVAGPTIAHDDEYDDDLEKASTFIGGEFDVVVLGDGTVEASLVVDAGLMVSSVEIGSEALVFGPVQEVEPGLWLASSVAPVGTECYRATAQVELAAVSESDQEDDDHDGSDSASHDDDDDHDGNDSRSHDDEDDHDGNNSRSHDDEDDDDEDSESKDSITLRFGATVCAPLATCAPPVGLFLMPPQ